MTIYQSNVVQNAQNKIYKQKKEINNLNDFKLAVSKDHVMCQFIEDERSKANFLMGDCIYGDIDNTHTNDPDAWVTIKQFSEMFSEHEYYLATSTSHQKEKNGQAKRDKYHVYFPVTEIEKGEKLEYWLKALTTKYDFFDPAVKDSARFFFGNPSSLVKYNKGKSILTLLHGFKVESEKSDPIPLNFDTGSRNDTMFRWACSLHGQGVNDEEMEVFLSHLNEKLPDQLSDREISTIIKSTHRYDQVNPKTLDDDSYIRNYIYIGTGELDNDGNEKQKLVMLDDPEDFDEGCEYFISFKDQSGKKFLFDKKELDYIISETDDFTVKLMNKKVFIDFRPAGVSKREYMKWVKDNCQSIERVSCIDEVEKTKKTIYFPQKVKAEKTGYFRKMIETMTFESIKDQYRFAAGLLSAFLGSEFDGRKPLFAVMANSQSSGKTSAVRSGIKLVQNDYPLEFVGDSKTDEQQLGGINQLGNKFVLYDNLQHITKGELLTITKTVTDAYIPAWFFGVSHARVKNNKTFFATFNSEESINSDVLNRIVTIRMKDGRDLTEEDKLSISKRIGELSKEKDKILADIYWGIEQEMTDVVGVKHHVKFSSWSDLMAGMLKVFFPEIDEFDFSLVDEDKELSIDSVMFEEFIEELLEGKDYIFLSKDDVYMKYTEHYGNNRATRTSMNRHIDNMKKSFTDKYEIDVRKAKKVMDKTMKGMEIIKITGNYP